jgi:Rrf2 family protein
MTRHTIVCCSQQELLLRNLFLKEIAKNQDISEKYLSLIVIPLRSAGLIRSIRGARGGYTLAKRPDLITVADIVDVLEGELCLVDCVKNPAQCPRVPICPTRDVWSILGEKIKETLAGISLPSLVAVRRGREKNAFMENI